MRIPHKIPLSELDLSLPIEIFDNSSLGIFNSCQRKYLFRVIMNLVGEKGSDSAEFGSSFHAALCDYYSGKHIDDCRMAFINRTMEDSSDIPKFAQEAVDAGKIPEYSCEFGVWLFDQYTKVYPRETDNIIPLEIDGDYYLEKGFAVNADDGVVVGKTDFLGYKRDEKNGLWITDHKTTKAVLNDRYYNFYHPNNQVTTYLWAIRELLGETPKGFIVNIIRVKDFKRGKIDDKHQKLFARIEIQKTDAQLDERGEQIKWQIKWINYIRDKGISAFAQNAPSACHTFLGDCAFIPLCMAQTQELTELLAETAYKTEKWQPYEVLEGVKEVLVSESLIAQS